VVKIRAYNKITKFAEELAKTQHKSGMQEVILNTDQAYLASGVSRE